MKVSVLQYEITSGRRKDHLLRLLALAEEAEGDLLAAPELALTGYSSEPTSDIPTEITDFVQRTGKSLLLGHPVRIGDAFRNAALLVSPERSLVVAEKEVLFPGLDEEAGFVPGDRKRVFQVGGLPAGVLLCYEVRFPEIVRRLVSRGTALLCVLAEWPAKRYAHLRALATARAIENQVFVVVANALGRSGELELAGRSFVVSPAGEILGELGKEEGVLTVELDPEALSEARELFNTSARRPPEPPEGKILALTEAVEEVRRRRALGHRMVFTNGCFDLLHAGHVSYLYEARRLGDFLVVGLNADESVRRLKGPERPINPQEERTLVLASLACVDYVVLFEEDTPERLIKTLEPDVLVKGADWREDKIVGAAFVKSRGGRVVRLPFRYQVSTTGLLERIRRG